MAIPTITEPGPPITAAQLDERERFLGVTFPDDYREFMLRNNGGRPEPDGCDAADTLINFFCELDDLLCEHEYLVIAIDAGGNFVCLGTGDDAGKVFFYPDEAESAPYQVASSFTEFLASFEP